MCCYASNNRWEGLILENQGGMHVVYLFIHIILENQGGMHVVYFFIHIRQVTTECSINQNRCGDLKFESVGVVCRCYKENT
jgi:hypothetical protein